MATCDVRTIDSNASSLSFAEEVCPKQLPTVGADGFEPTWFELEPNEYSDFGGDVQTVSRQPISARRQRKKGTPVSVEASAGFNIDLTQTNLTRLMQGFFAANARQKPTTKPFNGLSAPFTSIETADDSFNAAAGLGIFTAGHIVLATKTVSNNGVHTVVSSANGKVVVSTNLVEETAPSADAKLEAVGFQFASGAVALTASAASFTLSLTGLAAATGTYTITGSTNLAADETVTIGSTVYTAKVTPTGANHFKIGADKAATLVNLAAAINGGAGSGSLYGADTVANTQVTAVPGASTLVVTAKYAGAGANSIATTEVSTNGAWGAATLAGGTGVIGWAGLGILPGETVFIGGDLSAESFTETASTNRPGYARVLSVTDSALVLDDSTFTPQTDAGTGKTIRVYFGTLIRNEPNPDDIIIRTYQFEQTLGRDSDGTQAQYAEGSIPNELTLNIPDADKLNVDLSYIAMNNTTRTGLEGLKDGSRVIAPGEAPFNTSSDLYRIRLAVIDPTEMNSTALFALVTEASLTINNNAEIVRALAQGLGGVDVSVGNFDAGGSFTALFSTVEAIRAIRNNADVSLNIIAARANAGIVFDMPLLGLGGGRPNIELNKKITIPVEASGAENALGYTLASVWFPYLPTVAMPDHD